MSKRLLRKQVIKLRKQGNTYSQIREILAIPKSTLSSWLSNYPLSDQQTKRLEKNKEFNKFLAIEKIILTKQKKREKRLNKTYEEEKERFSPLSKLQLEIAGLFLYWGEGNKSMKGPISISNTDPGVIKFSLYWLTSSYHVPKEKIKVYLHLYSDMKVKNSQKFWSKELNIPLFQFAKPYIKESFRTSIDQKGFGFGTCTIIVSDIRLKEKIMMGIKSLADYYSDKILPML